MAYANVSVMVTSGIKGQGYAMHDFSKLTVANHWKLKTHVKGI